MRAYFYVKLITFFFLFLKSESSFVVTPFVLFLFFYDYRNDRLVEKLKLFVKSMSHL